MLLIAALMLMFGTMSTDPMSCLPPDIKSTDVVSVTVTDGPNGARNLKKVTVADELKAIGAHCVNGKLVDESGKEIRFFRLAGCWGNPPEDYQEILDRQERKLTQLRKAFHVIEMTCNPTGDLIH